MVAEDDPTAIRSIAVSAADIVDAFAYTQENPGEAVLRITPPFHGRMRARIHVYRRDDAELTGAVHVTPADALETEARETYPQFESIGDERTSGADESALTPDQRRKRHAEAVDDWRAKARESLVETVPIETERGHRHVELKPLG
ncbi:hypothetical protein [Natrialba taiwanensis]|uniref:DUF8009 domain-containing protein n=1 Tax=Natrialba taiwanensis DSM 12281 TaxID=1230458 RepID=M0AAM0_9EURY|nr:hypothetical protein [Natrialba taiwanensis]ELY95559.1 hypothetical protein C484_04700 [Natrialba taiwanensis DSM 12281]